MKTKLIKFTTLVLILAGSFYSCRNEDDIDMSKIDFSNIENLYAQPLPVIQKCVQGKWKWIDSGGNVVYIIYDNTFVDIQTDLVIIDYDDGSQRSCNIAWKKVDREGKKTYDMWEKETNQLLLYFESIRNDTIIATSYPSSPLLFWYFETIRNNTISATSYPSSTTMRSGTIVSNVVLHRFVRVNKLV